MKHIKKIILTGAPGTGKSSIINNLKNIDFKCFDEVWDKKFKNPSKNNDSDQIIDFSKYLFKIRKSQLDRKSTRLNSSHQ